MKNNIKLIVKTAIFLALLVVLQGVTKPFGTLITGCTVNFVLIGATIMTGISSGLVIAVVSPFLALLLGVVPLPIYIVPVVAVANAVLVLTYGIVLKKAVNKSGTAKYLTWIVTIVMAALLKFAALYALINFVVVPLVTAAVGAAKAPAALYSAQQMITAVIGGLLAFLVVPQVIRATKKLL